MDIDQPIKYEDVIKAINDFENQDQEIVNKNPNVIIPHYTLDHLTTELSRAKSELERLKKYENLEWQEFNELAVKDKIIDEMAKEIEFRTGSCPYDVYDYDLDCEKRCKHDIETECWIKYFTKKVEGK